MNISRPIQELFKYGVVGVSNTLLTLTAAFIMMEIFKLPYTIANVIGYVLGFLNSFILNRKWTFQSQGKLILEFMKFILIFIVCYLLQLLALVFLVEQLRVTQETATIIGMFFYTGLNFIGNKFITFRKDV